MGSRHGDAVASPSVSRRLAGDERREGILSAAFSLFAGAGVDGVALDDVAARAGVSRPLVYHYFPGKRALYLTALRIAADDLLTCLEAARGASGPEGLSQALGAYFDFVESDGAGYLVFVAASLGGVDPEVREIVEEVHEFLVSEVLVPLVGDPGNPLATLALRGWIAMVEVAGSGWARDRHMPRSSVEDFLVSVLPIVCDTARHPRYAVPAETAAPDTAARETAGPETAGPETVPPEAAHAEIPPTEPVPTEPVAAETAPAAPATDRAVATRP